MSLLLENLEIRLLPAVPIAPFDLDLLAGGDSGTSNSDDITNLNNGTLQLIAEKGSTVSIINAGTLGTATGQGDTLFFDAGDIVIEMENATVTGAMQVDNTQAGFQDTGYIEDTAATVANPALGGTATLSFYVATPGTYYAHARVYYPSGSENSFFINIDDTWTAGETGPSLWSSTYASWHFNTATTVANGGITQTWALAAGWHTMEVHGRENGAILDRIVLSTNATLPVDPGPAETILYETYQYTFAAGDLIGSNTGTINSITATAENLDGTGPASSALSITYDSATSTPGAPDLDAASDTGTSDTDNYTNDTTATFSGGINSVEGNSTVWIRVGGVDQRSTTANADGSYSVSLQAGDLAAGANLVDIYYIDTAGNTSADSADLTVTLDTTVAGPATPDLDSSSDTGTSNSDDLTSESRPLIQGSAGAVEANSTVQIWLDPPGAAPDSQIATLTAAGDGSWSYYFTSANPLQEGTNDIRIVAVDTASNTSVTSADLSITLDTTANAPANAPDLDSGSDTGSSNSDNITNDTTATFTGLAGDVEAGSTVWLRINGVNTRSATAAGDGSYSITLLNGDLSVGDNTVDVIYIDTAGNISSDSTDLTVTLDTSSTTPTSAPDLDIASDTGNSNVDDLTNDTTATFTGPANSVEANATVWVRVGGVDQRSATANADGSYSISLLVGDLLVGANTVDIYAIDTAGNTSADSADLTVTLDTSTATPTTPDLTDGSDTGSSNSDNVTAETQPTIRGLAGSVENNASLQIWLDTPSAADTQIGTTTAQADGSWSYTFSSSTPLEEGANQIHVVSVDPAGNTSSNSPDLTVTIDFSNGAEQAPDLTTVSDTGALNNDNITSDSTPTITGTSPNGAEIKIRTNETTIASFIDNDVTDGDPVAGQWSYTYPGGVVVSGANTIDYLTVDTSNIVSDWSLDLVITMDTSIEQPTTPVLSSSDDSGTSNGDQITNVNNPTISGTAEPGSTVTIDVNGGTNTDTVTAGADSNWSYTLTAGWLNEGANTIFAQATDIAGNTSAASSNLSITLDTTINAPSLPDLIAATDTGSSTSDDITSHPNPRLTGTADANTTITLRLDPTGTATVIDTTTASAGGVWSYTFTTGVLSEGVNVIDVTATDSAGNTTDSADLSLTIETAINTPTGLDLLAASDLGNSNTDNLTSLATATITGTADASNTVSVRVNGTTVGTTTSDGLGNWTYTFDGVDDLIEGINIIDAFAQDSVGNTSGFSTDLIVTLDTTVATPLPPDLQTASDTGTISTDDYTNQSNATISGTSESGSTILISLNGNDGFDTTVDADLDGVWTYTFAGGLLGSATGTANTIRIGQQDPAGNTSAFSSTITVTLDDSATTPTQPDLLAINDTGDSNSDNLTNQSNVTINGTIETDSSLQIYIDQGSGPVLTDTISETLVSTGNWTYTFSMGQLVEGSNQITVVATDKAGNTSASSPALDIVLDTTITQPGTPDLSSSSDTGDADNDDITSDDTPTFSGTAPANSHVDIRVDGEIINTVNADGSGDWTYTFTLGEIQTGVHQIDVIATDIAGNVSTASDDLTIWLNVVPTQPAAPNLTSESDTGSIDSDDLTFDTTPTINGKADPLGRACIHLNGVLIGDATADVNGFWEYTFAPGILQEGTHQITVLTEDTSGLKSAPSAALTLTIDTTHPQALQPDLQSGSDTGVSDTDNLTSDQTATISGTTEASAIIDVYHNTNLLDQLVATNTGNWSYTFALGQLQIGDNDVYVIITDVTGNVSNASESLTIILDIQQDTPAAPTLNPSNDTGSSANDGLTNNNVPSISGSGKANSSVDILVSGNSVATIQADTLGEWEYQFTDGQLSQGDNLIETISTDTVGNTTRSAALTISLDTEGPIIYNHFPKETHTLTSNVIELFVSGDDIDLDTASNPNGYTLIGSGGDGTFDDGNEWNIPINSVSADVISGLVELQTFILLTDDTYQLTVDPDIALKDQAGNSVGINLLTSTSTQPVANQSQSILFTFVIDTEGPDAPDNLVLDADSDSGLAGDLITNIESPKIQVNAIPDIAVEIISNGRSVGFASEISDGTYEIFIDNSYIREGDNLIFARAFDGLGNSSELSSLMTFIYDSQAPEVADIIVDPLWLNFGPKQISVVFNETDIDPNTVNNLDQYELIAAGGDGSFDDGNETTIALTNIDFEPQTHTLLLTLPQSATETSELTPDKYKLSILGSQTITDISGNIMAESYSEEFLVVPAVTINDNERYRFKTETGENVTVELKGKGDAQILLGKDINSTNLIEKITLSNSNQNTKLIIKASKNLPTAFTLGELLIDSPIDRINASRVDVTQKISVDENLNTLSIGQILDNTQINLTSSGSLDILAKSLGSNVDVSIDGHLDKLRTDSFDGGTLQASSVDKIQINAGDYNANTNITDGNLNQLIVKKGNLTSDITVAKHLNQVKIPKGDIESTISALDISLIQAHEILDSTISASNQLNSVQAQVGHDSKFMADKNINSLKIRHSFNQNTVASGENIEKIAIGGDAIDNLFLAGARLGDDHTIDGNNDSFSDGNIMQLSIKGSYKGSIATAAVTPGDDLTFFTADDSSASFGSISNIKFGKQSLADTDTSTYGMLASGEIAKFIINKNLFEAPLISDPFRLVILD